MRRDPDDPLYEEREPCDGCGWSIPMGTYKRLCARCWAKEDGHDLPALPKRIERVTDDSGGNCPVSSHHAA